jgi:hypothetical protein
LLEAGEAADERRLLSLTRPEPEGGRGVGHRQVDALGISVEAVGQVAQEQQRGRPESGEPERLYVPTARIVPDRIEHRVGPGHYPDRTGHRILQGIRDHVKLCRDV